MGKAPRNREDSKTYASIDADQEIGSVLNIGFATVIDVPGIEVQVPSLSSPGYSVWILISGHERFVNEIHRHNSDIVNCSSSLRAKEDNLESSKPAVVNHGQGSQDSNNVKTKMNLQACIGKPLLPRSGSPCLLAKQLRRQRRQQQSYVNTCKSKVHLREEGDLQGGQNLDFYSWMPEMQEGLI